MLVKAELEQQTEALAEKLKTDGAGTDKGKAEVVKIVEPVAPNPDNANKTPLKTEVKKDPPEPKAPVVVEPPIKEEPDNIDEVLSKRDKVDELPKEYTRKEIQEAKHLWEEEAFVESEVEEEDANGNKVSKKILTIDPETVLELANDETARAYTEKFAKRNGYKDAEELIATAKAATEGKEKPKASTSTKDILAKQDTEKKEYEEWLTKTKSGIDESVWAKNKTEFMQIRDSYVIKGLSLKEAGEIAFDKIENKILKDNKTEIERKKDAKELDLPDGSRVMVLKNRATASGTISHQEYYKLTDEKRTDYAKSHRGSHGEIAFKD